MPTNKPRIFISLPIPVANLLEETSRETGLTKSHLISILISKHLKKEKSNLKDLIPNFESNKEKGEEEI